MTAKSAAISKASQQVCLLWSDLLGPPVDVFTSQGKECRTARVILGLRHKACFSFDGRSTIAFTIHKPNKYISGSNLVACWI